jgi:hypothetical protein
MMHLNLYVPPGTACSFQLSAFTPLLASANPCGYHTCDLYDVIIDCPGKLPKIRTDHRQTQAPKDCLRPVRFRSREGLWSRWIRRKVIADHPYHLPAPGWPCMGGRAQEPGHYLCRSQGQRLGKKTRSSYKRSLDRGSSTNNQSFRALQRRLQKSVTLSVAQRPSSCGNLTAD